MSLFSYKNLFKAYIDCRKNKRNKPDALLFEINAEENIYNLSMQLEKKTYHPSFSTCFVTTKPKLREIFAARFKDRIVHHLLVRYLENIWEPIFIYDSYASRKNKGTHLATKRLKKALNKITHNETRKAFYMQLDIKNFFLEIDKNYLFELICSKCKNSDIIWLSRILIFHDPTEDYILKTSKKLLNKVPKQKSLLGKFGEKGLPIGNLTSQFFANIYLNELDQFVKHTLKCRYYMRYVDDFILLHYDYHRLENWHLKILHFLEKKLMLSLNKNRTKIRPISNGIDFLGYITRPGYTLCRNRVVNNLNEKLTVFYNQLISIEEKVIKVKYDDDILAQLFSSLNSYIGHINHADSNKLKQKIFSDNSWLSYYFAFQNNGKIIRTYKPYNNFGHLNSQYNFFQKRYHYGLIFFQVGCFYEFYDKQALKAIKTLKLKRIIGKYGFKIRCGISKKGLDKYMRQACESGNSVIVINQTDHILNNIKERKISLMCLSIY